MEVERKSGPKSGRGISRVMASDPARSDDPMRPCCGSGECLSTAAEWVERGCGSRNGAGMGVGVAMVMLTVIVSIYYNVIIAYSLYYMFASFQSPLPWSSCLSQADNNCSNTPIVYCNVSGALVANWTQENSTCPSSNMMTVPVQSPSEQYWDHVVLQRSSGLDETGPVVWHLALCLLLSSIIVAAALIRGIKSSGKVVYFTATFPYVVILILLIRGTSVLAGFAIFSILGHMAHIYKMPVGEVVKEGFGLAFIAYPDALSKLPISPLWSILFFFMLLTVGLDSQFAGIGDLDLVPNDIYATLLWRSPIPSLGFDSGLRLKSLCSPAEEWHPYLDIHRGERYSPERCRLRMSQRTKPESSRKKVDPKGDTISKTCKG
ncbi:Sodium- and chloride-dependent neutral and basic amino acid transporter B(0+) [Liparis tanakae]|uniref:Sodium-and chloride-dependent neutral and basic amino acid transporter B(0+) n=1 Tax=Liparis tanakae TaxID=230148 RepID=A0A4Z2FNX3_9TELE|nr:Sodium- and chloride-dependent neutral and basic amino acid transporter B(0+) [Liparis tanakae]